MDIRDNIKQVIKQHGMTSKEVADAKGVTKSAFAQTIANNPTVNTLQEIADIIGCDIAEFFTTTQQEDNNTITCPCCGAKLRLTPDTQHETHNCLTHSQITHTKTQNK